MMIRALTLVMFFGAISPRQEVHAAEAVVDEKPTEEEVASPSKGDEKDTAKPSDDVFVPTEEISEDAAVPFPVDI